MPNTIKLRRGPSANLPSLAEGELAHCTDTNDIYIGTSSGNVKIRPAQKSCAYVEAQALGEQSFTATSWTTLLSLVVPPGTWLFLETFTWAVFSTAYTVYHRVYDGSSEPIPTLTLDPRSTSYQMYEQSMRVLTLASQTTLQSQFYISGSSTGYVKALAMVAIRLA